MEAGRKHAQELLNCKGIYYPVGIGPKGLCTAMWPLTPEEMRKSIRPVKIQLMVVISFWDRKSMQCLVLEIC